MRLSDLPAETLAKFSHLLEGKPADLQFPDPTGYHVMVLQYVRPEAKTLAGGQRLYFADKTRTEDEFQGRVGLVLALGPDAYRDPSKYPSGPWVRPGDTVIWPTLETAAQRQRYHGLVIAFLPDDRVVGVGVDPALAVEAQG
jgi:hypothetical protein